MTIQRLPSVVRSFLGTHIQSIERLEVLLLLQQESEKWWSPDSVAVELGMSSGSAAERLEEMASRSLLDVRISESLFYRYAPATASLDAAVRKTARAYKEKPAAVATAIYSPPMDDIRSFADAFRIRKREGDDDA